MKVPEILVMPDKLLQMVKEYNNYRYFLIEGGRGGGKSQGVGRLVLWVSEQKPMRIVCAREQQTNITESVYSILRDLINKHNLNFEISATRLTHRETGTTINFRGFREQGACNIQGLEGIDLVWIDESQAITKQTLDVLIPTIRKDKAKIFFTMNRHVENDPVYEAFISRKDCLHISINYDENPYCTQALITEAEECKKKSLTDYDHIWLGQPLSKSEDALFSRYELISTKEGRATFHPGYGTKIAGFDVARFGDDKCACVIIQQYTNTHWEVIHTEQWDHRDLNYTTGKILAITNEQAVDKPIIDEDGLGAGPLDSLRYGRGEVRFEGFRNTNLSFDKNKFYGNPRTIYAYKLKELVGKRHIYIDNEDLIKELCTLRYNFDNHQRRVLISKDRLKKEGIRSPNLADSLVYAVSLIDDTNFEQERRYCNMPPYSPEGDLFKIAGV